jgi:hypothetical protein
VVLLLSGGERELFDHFLLLLLCGAVVGVGFGVGFGVGVD